VLRKPDEALAAWCLCEAVGHLQAAGVLPAPALRVGPGQQFDGTFWQFVVSWTAAVAGPIAYQTTNL
jgi:hypothetical protein